MKIKNNFQLASFIDYTILKPDATSRDIENLCREAEEYNFAAVCVNPVYVDLASRLLQGSNINVCTVISFPLGAASAKIKALEAAEACAAGAGEVDMVINIGALKEGLDAQVKNDIAGVVESVRNVSPEAIVKVIIETSLLTLEEKVKACKLVVEAGAHFVKTSTGFSTGGAAVEDIRLIKETVGDKVGIKASGGIRTLSQALDLIKAGANRLGTSAGVKIMKEFDKFKD